MYAILDSERRRRGKKVAGGKLRSEAQHAAPESIAEAKEPGTGDTQGWLGFLSALRGLKAFLGGPGGFALRARPWLPYSCASGALSNGISFNAG